MLELLGAALAAIVGALVGVPALLFATAPARRGRDDAQPIALDELAALPDGQPVRRTVVAPHRRDAWTALADVPLGAVWLVRTGERVRALSTVCPHAGCAVDWSDAERCFRCPCHDSRFAVDGARVFGPAPRDLDALETEVAAGRVRVIYRRFRPGVAEREET
jgi:Rieske Fe-S protein